MEGELVPQICEKSYCKKEFISSGALKEHMKTTHLGNQRSVCTKCGEICEDKNIKKYMESCSRGGAGNKESRENSKEVCYHWRRGFCKRGSCCGYSRVGRQGTPCAVDESTKTTPCRNGPMCTFLARGRCNFDQHQVDRHQDEQVRQGNSRNPNHSRGIKQGRNQQEYRRPCAGIKVTVIGSPIAPISTTWRISPIRSGPSQKPIKIIKIGNENNPNTVAYTRYQKEEEKKLV